MDFIDLKSQYRRIQASVNARIQTVLEHGQYVLGPECTELEKQLAEYVGTKHCIGASSGTDTLLIALMALDIGPGDEVITSPFTFIATGEVIALAGAKPVFVDIEPRTYNLDPALLEQAITPRTKAIMPVSLYGQCADMDAINAIAAKHKLPVIEDGAQSFGGTYKGKRSCGISTIGSTSFFPSKPLGGYGDGGALFTNDDGLAKLMREIRVHGQDRRYHHPRLGVNGRLDSLQAAILLAKMEIFEDEVQARARIGQRYSERINAALKGKADVVTPFVEARNVSVYAQYTLEVPTENGGRAQFEERMKAQGVPTAVHYPVSLHQQPVFANLGHQTGDFPVSERIASRVVSLPMHPYLDEATQDQVVAAVVKSVLG
jgi:UDP-2-acetamido-2-deoxy-ribo-hexuluronate aminotransferase